MCRPPGAKSRTVNTSHTGSAVRRGRLAGHGAAVIRTDPAFLLCGAGGGAGETAYSPRLCSRRSRARSVHCPGWFFVAVAAFEVDREDADQPGGCDERLDGAGGCAGLVGQRRGQGLLEAGDDFPLAGAQRGAVAYQPSEPGWVRLTARLLPAPLTLGPGWLCPWLPGEPGFRERQAGRQPGGRWR